MTVLAEDTLLRRLNGEHAMPIERPEMNHQAPPDIVQLADKYKSGFQTHLHVLASAGEIVSEEHRKGVIAECDGWLSSIIGTRRMTTHSAREIERIRIWARTLK